MKYVAFAFAGLSLLAVAACGAHVGRGGAGFHLGSAGPAPERLIPGVQLAYYDNGEYDHYREHRRCWTEWHTNRHGERVPYQVCR